MSDHPPSWPFPPPPPPTAVTARRPVGWWIALGLAVALLVGVGVTAAIVLTRDEPTVAGQPVLLEPAAEPGPNPFVNAVAGPAVPSLPDAVRAGAATTASRLTIDPATGTRTAAGTTDALFGGSGELGICDPAPLVDFLAANPAPGAAWAGVHGVAPDGIGAFVATLTPVVLLHDTVVTNYGFDGGVATPRSSVLEAGTAVLVDPTGTPAVRCACGNPLTAPTVRDLPAADLQGTGWSGFDPAAVLTVTADPPATTFTLVDVATGQTYQRSTGLASLAQPALLAATPAGIQRSTDARQWSVAAAVDQGALTSLDASPELVVAAGGTVSETDPTQHTGVILTSTDGTTWSAPIPVQDYVVDLAYGDGSWLAIGMTPSPGATQDDSISLVTYRSTDGAGWERRQLAVPVELGFAMSASSVVFGDGTWMVDLIGILGDGAVQATLTSPDGSGWTAHPGTGSPGAYTDGRAFNGRQWGITGSSVFFDDGLDAPPRTELKAGASADGVTWRQTPGTPTGSWVGRLSCTADRGWLAIAGDGGWSMDAIRTVHTSADLVTWSPLGTGPQGGVTDVIAVGAGTAPDASRCGTPAGSAPPTATAPAAPADGDLRLSVPISQPACDGSGIVVVQSAIHPETYAADVQDALNRFPGSRYLRTDVTGCSSLNQVSSIGTVIYAVYLPVGPDVTAMCAEAGRTGGYGKWLDNTSDPDGRIGCR